MKASTPNRKSKAHQKWLAFGMRYSPYPKGRVAQPTMPVILLRCRCPVQAGFAWAGILSGLERDLEFCITPCVRVPTKVNAPTRAKEGWVKHPAPGTHSFLAPCGVR